MRRRPCDPAAAGAGAVGVRSAIPLRFMAEAHRDIRTATQNSREWANAGASSGGATALAAPARI
jgi:hypothetical protein